MTISTHPHTGQPAPAAETEAERADRLAQEHALIEQAREDVRAGHVIADGDADAWLDLYTRGEPVPLPKAPPGPNGR